MILVKTAAVLAVLYAGIRWFEWSQTFHPSKRMDPDMQNGLPPFEEIRFMTEDGVKLHGWWFPHENARGAVIYCHGNAGNISTRPDVYRGLHALGLQVFAFDYRGYGKSRGIPTEKGLYRDVRAAYEVVRAKYDDSEDPPVLVFGASLGGAPAVRLAAEKPVKGLIIEGGFSSAEDVARHWYPGIPLHLILNNRLDSASLISRISVPVLIAHSTADRTIPYRLGRALYDAARDPKVFVDLRGEHGEAGWNETPEYFQALQRFVDRVLDERR